MKELRFEILLVIGLVIGFFVLIIPFADVMPEVSENILFFRGILVAGLLFCIYGAINLNGFYRSIVTAIGGGVVALTVMSSYNLICDVCIDTYYYYLITFLITSVTLVVLLSINLWSKLSQRSK